MPTEWALTPRPVFNTEERRLYLVRGDKLLIAHHDVVIEPGDHVILFVMDKREIAQVSALFQTGATWL